MIDQLYIFLRSIRWQDAVDITLNSYILFRFYVLFRGTNILRVLIGILFLLFFQRVAATTGLILTSWVIQGVTAAAALIIIVVFRDEIRIVLQTRNLKTFFFGSPRKAAPSPVGMIAKSVFDLAQRHCGALLVFPGKKDLKEVVHSGILWNGIISEEMIKSIFWHDNPVHDGACIIQNDRITEVGVILPLSRRKELPSHYGTRHRAAVGLSEQTDALALVVSEESGRISVAKNARIQTIRHQAQLEKILNEHTGIELQPQQNNKKNNFKKIAAALLAFIFVSGVWFTITRGVETLITLEVPVKLMNLDSGMEILETSNNKVRLQLSGSEVLIRSIRPEKIDVRIDLSNASPGQNTYVISEQNISLPPGIELNSVEQQRVEVSLDAIVTKRLYVQVNWIGRLKDDLIMGKVRLEPATVEFTGGSRILEHISTIYTEPVALNSVSHSGKTSANLVFDPKTLKPGPDFKERITIHYIVKNRE